MTKQHTGCVRWGHLGEGLLWLIGIVICVLAFVEVMNLILPSETNDQTTWVFRNSDTEVHVIQNGGAAYDITSTSTVNVQQL